MSYGLQKIAFMDWLERDIYENGEQSIESINYKAWKRFGASPLAVKKAINVLAGVKKVHLDEFGMISSRSTP